VEHEEHIVKAHDQMLTLHISQHVEDHAPRENDPHYALFEQAKRRLKKAGLWKCIIDDELCGGHPELHHSYVEFSEIESIDPKKVERLLGLHFEDEESFRNWAQSPGNLEVLCTNHHRSRYGVHVLPEPLWLAVRLKKSGMEAPAHFIPAKELATKEND
jgi:hypothetical protein